MNDWKAEYDAEILLRREWSARAHKAEAALAHIATVCADNAPTSCDKVMALNFVRQIAVGSSASR
jgi:hypothetical protein